MNTRVVTLLKEMCSVDYMNYAESSLERRIEAIVVQHFGGNHEKFENYLSAVSRSEAREIVNKISVNTTEFYRDYALWKILMKDIIPPLANYNMIRIWHAGCSTGEEVYSMAVLIAELGLKHKTKIIASDISDKALQTAKNGVYSTKTIIENQENIHEVTGMSTFRKYFTIHDNQWKANTTMLPEISFTRTDLSNVAPFSKFDIILCRNVMIYFNLALQERLIDCFSKSLFRSGKLITGKKESVKLVTDNAAFRIENAEERIFAFIDG